MKVNSLNSGGAQMNKHVDFSIDRHISVKTGSRDLESAVVRWLWPDMTSQDPMKRGKLGWGFWTQLSTGLGPGVPRLRNGCEVELMRYPHIQCCQALPHPP